MESIDDKDTCPGAERRHVTASLSLSLLLGIAACGGDGGDEGTDDGPGGGADGGGGDHSTSCDQPIATFGDGFDPYRSLGAADGSNVYVHNDGADNQGGIYRVPASGGEPELVVGPFHADSLVIDQTHIYWTALDADGYSSEIARVPKAGGAVESLLSAPEMHLRIVAVVDGMVVFVRDDLDGMHRLQVRDAEGNVTDLADVAGMVVSPGIAVHHGHAYFGRDLGDESGVARLPLTGGTPEWLAMDPEDPNRPWGILSGDTNYVAGASGLFVASQNSICAESGIVARVDWDSGEIQFIATDQPCPLQLRVDATHVAWQLAPDTGQPEVKPWSIVAAPVGGGDPQTVAVGDSDGTPRVSLVDLADGVVFYASAYDLCRRDL